MAKKLASFIWLLKVQKVYKFKIHFKFYTESLEKRNIGNHKSCYKLLSKLLAILVYQIISKMAKECFFYS